MELRKRKGQEKHDDGRNAQLQLSEREDMELEGSSETGQITPPPPPTLLPPSSSPSSQAEITEPHSPSSSESPSKPSKRKAKGRYGSNKKKKPNEIEPKLKKIYDLLETGDLGNGNVLPSELASNYTIESTAVCRPQLKASYWEHFKWLQYRDSAGELQTVSEIALCGLCFETRGYYTTFSTLNRRLGNHLNSHHQEFDNKQMGKDGPALASLVPASSSSTSSSTYSSTAVSLPQVDDLNETFTKLVTSNLLSPAIFESEEWRNFFSLLSHGRWTPPDRAVFRASLSNNYRETLNDLRARLKNAHHAHLTLDFWTFPGTSDPYLGVVVQWEDHFELNDAYLYLGTFVPPHTGIAIADAVEDLMRFYLITDKVRTVTTEGTSIMIAFGKEIEQRSGGRIKHQICYASSLQLSIRDLHKHVKPSKKKNSSSQNNSSAKSAQKITRDLETLFSLPSDFELLTLLEEKSYKPEDSAEGEEPSAHSFTAEQIVAIEYYQEAINTVKQMANFFHHSPAAAQQLYIEAQRYRSLHSFHFDENNNLHVQHDVHTAEKYTFLNEKTKREESTRYNSRFYMIERTCLLKDAMIDAKQTVEKTTLTTSPPAPSNEQWLFIYQVIQVLRQFEIGIRCLISDKAAPAFNVIGTLGKTLMCLKGVSQQDTLRIPLSTVGFNTLPTLNNQAIAKVNKLRKNFASALFGLMKERYLPHAHIDDRTNLYEAVVDSLLHRDKEHHLVLAAALDPHFWTGEPIFRGFEDKIVNTVVAHFSAPEAVPPERSTNELKEQQQFMSFLLGTPAPRSAQPSDDLHNNMAVMEEFLRFQQETRSLNVSLHDWWKNKALDFRQLSRHVGVFLSMPVTSSNIEALCLRTDNILNPRTARINPAIIQQIVIASQRDSKRNIPIKT